MPVNPPTFDSLREDYRTKVTSVDDTLTDWSAGSNLDALSGAAALLADETIGYALKLHRDRFFDTVTSSEALDALMLDRLNLLRKEAVAAVGVGVWVPTVTPAYTIPAGTTITGTLPGGGGSYTATTTEAATSDSGLPIPVVASFTGPSGNVEAGVLTTPVSFAADPGATFRQDSRMAGGADRESDDSFIARGRVYYQSLEKGTVAALEAAALSTPGVQFALVDEVFNRTGSSVVTVFIADSEGAGNATLAILANENVQAVVAAGILTLTEHANRETPALTVTIRVKAGSQVSSLKAAAYEAALNYLNNVPPGKSWYSSEVAQEVHNVDSRIISVTPRLSGALFESVAPTVRQNSLRAGPGNLTILAVEV